MANDRAYLCHGKKCRKHSGAHGRLSALLAAFYEVKAVRCQGFCAGPVAGIPHHGETRWFEDLRSAKARRRLSEWLDGGKLRKALRKREVCAP